MLGQLKRIQLKLLFIFGLIAAITISGCGGDSSSDPVDAYLGTWKSKCYQYSAGVYTQHIRIVTKQNATQFLSTDPNTNAYSDANCTVLTGTGTLVQKGGVFSLGAKATFLGQSVDTFTFAGSGLTASGYITTVGNELYMAVTVTATPPTSWGASSPETKL
jgi:hypothetical protein